MNVRRIALFAEQYPKANHAFIRRELQALERLGVQAVRWSSRSSAGTLVDPDDLAEERKTQVMRAPENRRELNLALAQELARPERFFEAASMADRLGAGSGRVQLLAEASLLKRWARAQEIKHVHVHFGTRPTTVALLSRLLGGPSYSFAVHGPDEFDEATTMGLRDKVEHAAFTAAITSFCRSQLFRWVRFEDWSKIEIVRCGLDSAFLDAEPVPAPDAARFVCVGRLCEQKGQLLLVEAAAKLRDRGHHFELVLVGDGEMRSEIEHLITQRNLQDTVHITGWASSNEVRAQLQSSRALICASFAEGLPVVIQEASALGRPSLSTYIAGIPELVDNETNGWLVYAGSSDALADKMAEILHTPIERIRDMGRRAHEAAAAKHSADREAQKLLDAIEKYSD